MKIFAFALRDYDEKEITPSTQRIRDIVDTEFGFEEILDEICDEHMNIKDDYEYNKVEEDINNAEMPVEPEV